VRPGLLNLKVGCVTTSNPPERDAHTTVSTTNPGEPKSLSRSEVINGCHAPYLN